VTDWRRSILTVVLPLATLTAPVAAQANRAALIDEARTTFEDSTVIRILHSAMDPALGGRDSMWAVAGYELAFAFLRSGQPERAGLWLQTVARHAPGFAIDRINFPPNVLAAYDQAVSQVSNAPDQGTVETRWRWPDALDPDEDGTIEVAAPATGAQVEATVESVGPILPGGLMSLPAGTYTITVSTDGWEPVRVERAVLPGTATMLEVDLVPLLSAVVEAEASANVVRITYDLAGQQVCRSGYFAGTDGLVLTTLAAVRDASAITVSTFDGSQSWPNVPVIATDTGRGLAVLRLPLESTTPSATATDIATGEYAWSVPAPGCDDGRPIRTRISAWNGTAPASLAPALPASVAGAPLIDRGGFLIGIVTGPSAALPDALTRDLVERARALIAVQVRPPSGGGFPWTWVGLGAAAAGVGVALAGGGGGGDDGGTTPPPPTTGGIIIVFPN
jgi:hypothetical protein